MQPSDTDFPIRTANDFLGSQSFTKMLKNAQLLIQLEKIINQIIPAEIAPHCRVQSLESAELSFTADSGVWATRLRLMSSELLASLQAYYPSIKKIQVVVRPIRPTKLIPAKKIANTSYENAKIVSNAAKFVKNEKLKESLERLAKTLDSH